MRKRIALALMVLPLCVVACKRAGAPAPPPLPEGQATQQAQRAQPSRNGATPQAGAGNAFDPAKLTERAPAKYTAQFETSVGTFEVVVERELAPNGADRFYNLVKSGFYDGTRFFRVVPGFIVQWGIHGDPAVGSTWRDAHIQDDPVKGPNKRGSLVFATAGPGTRTTQLFINLKDNAFLNDMGFAPFGDVSQGMDVVEKITSEYGETPNQMMIQSQGNTYLNQAFPKLDYIKQARIKA